jgi:predicted metal-dependent peptidase
MRPNRRFIHSGLYLPSLTNEGRLENLVLAIDVSGSIDQIALSMFAGSVSRIQDEIKPEKTTVIFCNSHITEIREFGPDDEIDLSCYGMGGTDLRPPFEWVEENGITPDVFLYFTDLDGPKPDTDTGYPVLWAMHPCEKQKKLDKKYLEYYGPAFGRVIQLT